MFKEILELLEDLKSMREMSEAFMIIDDCFIRIKRFRSTINIEVTDAEFLAKDIVLELAKGMENKE